MKIRVNTKEPISIAYDADGVEFDVGGSNVTIEDAPSVRLLDDYHQPVVRCYADAPPAPDADNEGPCPSCGAELGRDHNPGCRLLGPGSDLTHCQRVVQERRERCIVLWNALRWADSIIYDRDEEWHKRAQRCVEVALEGGPLGHQGHITDDDRLSLDDLERVSGARGHLDDIIADDEIGCSNAAGAWGNPDGPVIARIDAKVDPEALKMAVNEAVQHAVDASIVVKNCPVCGNRPTMFAEIRKVWIACHTCAADGGKFEGPRVFEHVQAMIAWNAVVDAWDCGFATAEAGAE